MSLGRTPMARRMPISVVRSFAVMVLQLVEMGANSNGGDAHFQVSFGLAVGTCALLIALGMLAGLAPAYRAMAIKPIEAIRDE